MKNLILLTLLIFTFVSYTHVAPSWLKDVNHSVSPDGKVYVYQEVSIINNEYKIFIGTWVIGNTASGGSGFFDLISDDSITLDIKWLNDSTVLINHPDNCEIVRKESESYFDGRKTYFRYKIK